MNEIFTLLGISNDSVKIENVVLNQSTQKLSAELTVNDLVNYSVINKLRDMIENKTVMDVDFNIHFLCIEKVLNEDSSEFITDLISEIYPYITSFSVSYVNCRYNVKCSLESFRIIADGGKTVDDILLQIFKDKVPVEFICEEVKPKQAANRQSTANNSASGDMLYGRANNQAVKKISDITLEPVNLIGQVFGYSERKIDKIKSTSIKFNITDFSSSVLCELFSKDTKIKDLEICDGQWLEVYGEYTIDDYSGKYMVKLKGIKSAENPYKRVDNCQLGKRVELHLHTQMSAMDSTLNIEQAIALADSWGHKAIAITDHGVVQSFPEAYDASKRRDINVIFGCEGYLFDDKNQFISNSNDNMTLDDEIVVFDLETTGFYPGQDKITEIGAVKIKNGEVVESFQTFVNPKRLIPPEVTKLTGITDQMVADAPGINEALDLFYDFAKGCILSAHNSKFDTSFLYYFDEQERFNVPVIDTLAVARRLLPELKNHKLNTCVAHLNIILDNHHRADADAKATAEMLIHFIKMYKEEGLLTLNEVNEWSATGNSMKSSDKNHVILLAKDKTGLHNLYELVSVAHLDYFYKKPRIPKSFLAKKREGLLIGSACEQGELFQAILRNETDKKLEEIASFYDFLEIQPTANNMFLIRKGQVKDKEGLEKINKKIYKLGKKLGKPVVATCDAHFIEEQDQVFRKILQIGQGYSVGEEDTPLYLRTTEEMMKEFAYLGDEIAKEVVIDNTNLIADMCTVEKPFPDDKTYAPTLEGAEEELTSLTYDTAHQIYGEQIPDIVQKRIDKELNSICGYNFETLYMIAQKIVKKSLDDGYLVGSRGSVGSSVVAFLCGITEVNPLPPHYICPKCKTVLFDVEKDRYPCGKDLPDQICENCGGEMYKDGYDIPFETFLGFKGDKVPDIDLNFSGEYQPKAHKYIEELFGEGFVYRAGTVSTLQDKTAYGFVKKYTEEYMPEATAPEIDRLVSGCVGVKRTTGQHPGGIVIVPKEYDIFDFTPIQYPADTKEKDVITTHFDFNSMHDVLVKVDALGHDDPTMLRMLQDLTGIDPKTVPLDDKETMALFSSTSSLKVSEEEIHCKVGTYGIPEFGTPFVRQMLVETKPKTMEELVRISGLSHGTDVWVGNAQDLVRSKKVTLREAICTRDDIMNYLISIGVEFKTAFDIMELVRKGKGSKLSDDQMDAMKAAKTPKWFVESCLKIGYMFPKAHAAAYVMMAFRIAWYKVNYPVEYYAAFFSRAMGDFDASLLSDLPAVEINLAEFSSRPEKSVKDKIAITILEVALEMYKRGFEFLPVDLYKSNSNKFTIENGAIRMPFRAIPGLGDAVANAIVVERELAEFLSIDDVKARTKLNKTSVETMKNMGCLEGMSDSNQLSLF